MRRGNGVSGPQLSGCGVAAKRGKAKERSQWTGRLAGIALCAFFALGVLTGLSPSGHDLSLRVKHLLRLAPKAFEPSEVSAPSTPAPTAGAIALVEHPDGFYELDPQGDLHGPVSPSNENDMPILSGAALANASAQRLLDCASIVVRAEAGWGLRISEMRVDREEMATLFLDRPALAITLDFDQSAIEIERAAQVLAIWRGHRDLLAALDLTVPGQAVVRLRPAAFHMFRREKPGNTHRAMARVVSRNAPEVTASR